MSTDRLSGTIAQAGDDDIQAVSVQLGDDKPQEQPGEDGFVGANLVKLFTDAERSKIARRCLDDYEDDVKSREPHMRMLRRWYELYASVTKTKDWPFQNCANVNIPLLAYTILQIHGRLYDALIPSKGDVFNTIPTRASDPEDVDRAERTELYLNWYIRDRIPEFRPSYDATIWQLVAFGSCFRHSYWDALENRLRTDWVSVEDFVVPYHCRVSDPEMRDVPHYTLVRHLSLFELQDRAEKGEFDEDVVATLKAGDGGTTRRRNESEFKDVVKTVDGSEEPQTRDTFEDEDRDVYAQHRWLRLPNRPNVHPAFDGKPHPVKIEIDEASEKILSIMLREEDDPVDAQRFAKEQGAFQQAQQAHQQFAQSGGMTQQPDPMTGQPVPVPMPPPPPLAPEPAPVRQRQVCFFTHWKAFQGEGFYGLGLGHFVGPINEAMNTLFNQQIDRSTVNNAGGGIISRQIRFQRGSIDRQPGKYVEVDAPASAVKDGLQNWPMVPPDPDGRWFVQSLETWANRTSGAGDTLSGEPIGANETARAAMARFEQATKQISVLASRILSYMTCDVRIFWRLFSVYLDEQEFQDVVDSHNHPRKIKIGRDDFKADAKVVPTADSRMASRQQRVSDAMDAFNFACNPAQGAPPELANNPAVRRSLIETVLYAMDLHEAIDLLGPPPGTPQPPPPKPQWEENAGFLRDQDQPVNQQDDDDAHLMEIQSFKQDPLGYAKLSPTGRKMVDNHERGHLAAKLEKTRQAHEQQAAAMAGTGRGTPPGLPPAPPHGPPGVLPS